MTLWADSLVEAQLGSSGLGRAASPASVMNWPGGWVCWCWLRHLDSCCSGPRGCPCPGSAGACSCGGVRGHGSEWQDVNFLQPGLRPAEYHFCHILLVKVRQKTQQEVKQTLSLGGRDCRAISQESVKGPGRFGKQCLTNGLGGFLSENQGLEINCSYVSCCLLPAST